MYDQLHGMSKLMVALFAAESLYLGVFPKVRLQISFVTRTIVRMFTGHQQGVVCFCMSIEVPWLQPAYTQK